MRYLVLRSLNLILWTRNVITAILLNMVLLLHCSLLFISVSIQTGDLFHLVDQFTHNRLRLSVQGFRNFGVSLLGRPISFTTMDIFGNFSSNYNFIDSSFVQLLVIDGLAVSAFMLFALDTCHELFCN